MAKGDGIVHWVGNYEGREKARESHSALVILSAFSVLYRCHSHSLPGAWGGGGINSLSQAVTKAGNFHLAYQFYLSCNGLIQEVFLLLFLHQTDCWVFIFSSLSPPEGLSSKKSASVR